MLERIDMIQPLLTTVACVFVAVHTHPSSFENENFPLQFGLRLKDKRRKNVIRKRNFSQTTSKVEPLENTTFLLPFGRENRTFKNTDVTATGCIAGSGHLRMLSLCREPFRCLSSK